MRAIEVRNQKKDVTARVRYVSEKQRGTFWLSIHAMDHQQAPPHTSLELVGWKRFYSNAGDQNNSPLPPPSPYHIETNVSIVKNLAVMAIEQSQYVCE